MKLLRAKPLRFQLEDGRSFTIQAPTIEAYEACLALDPDDAAETEGPESIRTRTVAQLRLLCGVTEPAEFPLDSLDHQQATQVIQCVSAHVHGYDPIDFLALRQALDEIQKKVQRRYTPAQCLAHLGELTLSLAVHTHCPPAAAAKIPVLDGLNMMERIAKNEADRAKWEASLAGVTLQ